jgi:hypothetical protein
MRPIFLQNWLPRWNQILTQLRFIHKWVITGIQWMVRSWWVVVHRDRPSIHPSVVRKEKSPDKIKKTLMWGQTLEKWVLQNDLNKGCDKRALTHTLGMVGRFVLTNFFCQILTKFVSQFFFKNSIIDKLCKILVSSIVLNTHIGYKISILNQEKRIDTLLPPT